ncbi:MAG TPA: Spy/CpxP family protein refolding chaperone [Caulobacteraceae bacterium]
MASLRPIGLALIAAMVLGQAAHAQSQGPDLHRLHDALNLSAAQEEAWNTFEAASRPDPQDAARERSAASMMPALHAPQRVDLSVAAMQADLDALERRGAALKTFYGVLSPEQQTAFDKETAPRTE